MSESGSVQSSFVADLHRFANEMTKKYENSPDLKGMDVIRFFDTQESTVSDRLCVQLLDIFDETVMKYMSLIIVDFAKSKESKRNENESQKNVN